MVAASLAVPAADGIAKLLSTDNSPFFIAWSRYFAASIVVLVCTMRHWQDNTTLRRDLASNALRTMLIVSAMTCFLFAITEIPLATAFGGYFLGPVIAAVVAAPLLGERITQGRFLAAILGLLGAMLIVRPGIDLRFGSILAILSGILFAGYLIATRFTASSTAPIDALRFQCVFGTILLTPFAVLEWSWPTGEEMLLIGLMGAISATCHFMVIAAFRHAEAVVLSPLSYLELVTAVLFGYFVLSEVPGGFAIAGITLIVFSGLIIFLSQRAAETRQ